MNDDDIARAGRNAAARMQRRRDNAARTQRTHSEARRLAGRDRVRAAAAAGHAPKALRIPITNTFDYSDYSAALKVGSHAAVVNVILDTGSSTLAVDPTAYSGRGDAALVPTTLAQRVMYGTGGWLGPVVNTTLTLGDVALAQCPVAITSAQDADNFNGVTGILGLAYYGLNYDYDLSAELAHRGEKSTYPWTLTGTDWKTATRQFDDIVDKTNPTQGSLWPYFDQLEKSGVVANKFAFYTKRSWSSLARKDWQNDPLNHGWFILGGGEEQKDLYRGAFLDVEVLHDVYYNAHLKSVRVGQQPAVAAAALQPQYRAGSISNAIIDSGTGNLSLAEDVYNAVLQGLRAVNPRFLELAQESIKRASQDQGKHGIPVAELDLTQWPKLYFVLTGKDGADVELCCEPSTYWQVDFPEKDQAIFQIGGPLGAENQSVLGLPLLNNYYTVFDRTEDSYGVVRFAPIR